MIRRLELRRVAALTILFIGLLLALSALGFAAQGRPLPAVTATIAGLAVCALAVRWLWRLPAVVPDEESGPGSTP